MTPANLAGQFGDTTYTKVFVGGLAWETQRETMKKYFEQFGEILEAVVITDKNTGRSKGYGFVTFRDPDAAMRACVDAAPVIDGRRANCNLASLGVQKSRPSTPKHGTLHTLRITLTLRYYNVYGGGAQYPLYGAGANGLVTGGSTAAAAAFYPYLHQFAHSNGGGAATYSTGQGYGVHHQYPHYLFQYSTMASAGFPQHYAAGPMSLAPSAPTQAGVTMALTAPTLQASTPHHPYRLIPGHFATPTAASEQPSA
ncbi:hypothetical protein Scep_003002 [Stephania cephalantha]|uniref:RRM domain-containing protein n=1 Tax=Stephania cephalantha TaxID=152367 RepID=A0AAP0LB98_9MAGN